MPLFEPITNSLPPVNVSYEGTTLDAKRCVHMGAARPFTFDEPELAKDVAAFANALGGTILIGAAEDQGCGLITEYKALTDVQAAETIKAFNQAISTRCSPRPHFEHAMIQLEGGHVVAINVWPSLGQVIGVSEDGNGNVSRRFNFPLRVGHKTDYIPPENHPMFMIPGIRRTLILLEGIPDGEERKGMQLHLAGGGASRFSHARFEKIDLYKNIAIFHATPTTTTAKTTSTSLALHIALDDIESVWKGGKGVWSVRLRRDAFFCT